jgi:hypothetical protein
MVMMVGPHRPFFPFLYKIGAAALPSLILEYRRETVAIEQMGNPRMLGPISSLAARPTADRSLQQTSLQRRHWVQSLSGYRVCNINRNLDSRKV